MCALNSPFRELDPQILPNTVAGNVTPSADYDVKNFLETIHLPGIGLPLSDIGRVLDVKESDNRVEAAIELGFPAAGAHDEYAASIAAAVAKETGQESVDITFSTRIVHARAIGSTNSASR